jgi:polyhydroxybutyrate depolymerase
MGRGNEGVQHRAVAGLRAGRAAAGEPRVVEVDDCRPRRPVPVLAFHGQKDFVNPYVGNDDLRWGYSVPVALQTWARLDRCRRGPLTTPIREKVTRLTYTDCRKGATVELYRLADGMHLWPGSPEDTGFATHKTDASRIMWRFFERH